VQYARHCIAAELTGVEPHPSGLDESWDRYVLKQVRYGVQAINDYDRARRIAVKQDGIVEVSYDATGSRPARALERKREAVRSAREEDVVDLKRYRELR
jgi:hypothetical protein